MGQSKSKLKCMYLPAQSGKTRKCEESISKELNRELNREDEIRQLIDLNQKITNEGALQSER